MAPCRDDGVASAPPRWRISTDSSGGTALWTRVSSASSGNRSSRIPSTDGGTVFGGSV